MSFKSLRFATQPTNTTSTTPNHHTSWNAAIPLCDIIFTVVSLSTYLCVIIFDLAVLHALYNLKNYQSTVLVEDQKSTNRRHGPVLWFWLACAFLSISFIVTQIVSMNWCVLEFRSTAATRAKAHALLNHGMKCDFNQDQKSRKNEAATVLYYLDSWTYIITIMTEFIPLILLHVLQLHVVWRHCKLFISSQRGFANGAANRSSIKDRQEVEFCRLSVLRLCQTFFQCLPMFLLKTYILITSSSYTMRFMIINRDKEAWISFKAHGSRSIIGTLSLELLLSSTSLSLFNLSWSLATYDKAVFYALCPRRVSRHRLHFTWLAIFLKTMANGLLFFSRSLILLIFALSCMYWALLMGAFHWLLMVLWLYRHRLIFESPNVSKVDRSRRNPSILSATESNSTCHMQENNILKREVNAIMQKENIDLSSLPRHNLETHRKTFVSIVVKLVLSITIGIFYVFIFVNLESGDSKLRITTYYMLMFIENTLMVTIWLHQMKEASIRSRLIALLSSYLTFFLGILFLLIYYRCVHCKLKVNQTFLDVQRVSCKNLSQQPQSVTSVKKESHRKTIATSCSILHSQGMLSRPPIEKMIPDNDNTMGNYVNDKICKGCGTNLSLIHATQPFINRNVTSSSHETGEKMSTTNTSNEFRSGCGRGIVSCYYKQNAKKNRCEQTAAFVNKDNAHKHMSLSRKVHQNI